MTHNQELLSETIKFKDQDFNYLRDRCLSKRLLFEDETFPADPSSIGGDWLQGKDLSRVTWKRPKELLMGRLEPHFILEGASRFDIQQGSTGNCWFLAALGSLTMNKHYLQKILIPQSFSHQYAGIFLFRFWQCGQWVEVVVDDRLPVLNNNYLFVHPFGNNQEFWPSLLEKAYAKFHGSYHQLHSGYPPDALVDLTGGVVTSLDLHCSPSDLVMMVKTAAKAGSLMTCATLARPSGSAAEMENGLVSQHAYAVTTAERVWSRSGWEDIICLWNPWGHTEWRGRWRDGSPEWQDIQDPRESQLYKNKNDGEFWMPCEDFQQYFSCLYVCNQFPVHMDHGNMSLGRWSKVIFKYPVTPGDITEGLRGNLQFVFSVPESVGGSNVHLSFSIKPQSKKARDERFPLHFQVFKVDPQFQHLRERLPPAFFSKFRNAERGVKTRYNWNFMTRFSLSAGTYVTVVSVHREEVEFFLQIFLKMQDGDRNLGSNFNLRALKGRLPENGSQESIFSKYAQQARSMDATQLQLLLNQEILKGPALDTFSLDQCQSIVALMDLKVNGQLDQEEFSRLWGRLLCCQSVFQNNQRSSGLLQSSDLFKAINDTDFLAGISVSNELLDLVALRYSDSAGTVSFPSLVCLLMRLEGMAKTFKQLSKDGKGLYLTKMEWMNLVMYS